MKFFENKWIIISLIVIAVVLPYFNIFSNQFAYDDKDFFLNWQGIKSVDIDLFFTGDAPMYFHHAYRPIRSVIQSVVYQFSNTNPFGYHVFAIVIHFLNVVLVYLISKKILNKIIGLISAVVFAVLPIHTMSVTFMAAIFNTIGILFLLISFYLYILFQESKDKKYFYSSLILALIAFFTYELTLILFLLIILYDLCFKRITKSQIKYYFSYFSGAILFLIIRFYVLKDIYIEKFLTEIGFFSRMLTMSQAFIKYIYLTIINFPLSVHYDTEISQSFNPQVIFSILIIIGLLGLAFWFYKKNQKIYTFIILWFFISLLPVSNIVPIAFFISEQYLYLASFAWVLLLGVVFYKVYENKQNLLTFLIIIFVLLSGIYGSMTWSRNKVWQNDETLWKSVLAKQPNSLKAHNNLAFYYRNQVKYDLAKEHLKKILEINPNYSLAYVNLGEIYLDQGHFEQAIKYFRKAISLRSNYAASYYNLGFCYQSLGQFEKSEENYKKAIEIYPVYFQSHKNLAVLYLGQGKYDKAIKEFQRAIEIQKNDYESYFGIGLCYFNQGQKTESKKYFQKTLEINPDFSPAKEYLLN